ncbi:MAG: hypothetical protein NTX25_21600, partial [Proteobacteria bacterium]|nr:hypothetical protein [Pseudomonadota bacterium]
IQGAVYRGVIQKMKFQNYVLAVSFLGAFIAGPIFNGAQLKKMENIHLEFPTLDRIYQKLHFFIGAILFKYVFANWLAQWVSLNESLSPLMIARSVFCFELQIYFDFAAYSLFSYFFCYIFLVPMYHNFNEPFSARDIPEFWRRWHVGLGTFFKENVFLPLRTVFPGQISTQFILPILVFTLSAAWHGPTRNFLLWGLFHGLSFALSVAILRSWRKFSVVRLGARIQMFVVIFYGRLIFMESDFERLMYKFRQLGMFKDMGREISVLLVAPTQVAANLWQHWDDTFIGLSIAAVLVNQIWFIPAHDGSCYRFLKPGAAAILLFILSLLFFQPHNNFGFVYGR